MRMVVLHNHPEETDLVRQCQRLFAIAIGETGSSGRVTRRTAVDYAKLALSLVNRASHSEAGLMDVVQATSRSSTYFKRMAAIRYVLVRQHEQLLLEMSATPRPADFSDSDTTGKWQRHLDLLQQYHDQQKKGFIQTRRRRVSKRQALQGLRADWREKICRRSENGKYGFAMLVAALTGCRPAELERGVVVWESHGSAEIDQINFRIEGVKVNEGQGQPHRCISYRSDDPHPLVRAIRQQLGSRCDKSPFRVQIEKAVNFTVEVRRLAQNLWPTHPYSVTAYCFRHQWAADLKRTHSANSVSKGLGHISAKTRRYYGQAGQSKGSVLHPVVVNAEREVRLIAGGLRHGLDHAP
ncbi:hypothetical protein D3C86_1017960 [compost metagenome]